jgi:hypothetical protein
MIPQSVLQRKYPLSCDVMSIIFISLGIGQLAVPTGESREAGGSTVYLMESDMGTHLVMDDLPRLLPADLNSLF